ncbi:MAG: flagellar filament capping protein FliD [Planctomycetales bacterium]|nr:flagellar filament capping protein FliD [Planctomycetales bacterium]
MGRIQSNIGLITGVNITDTVDQLMAINSIPRDRLSAKSKSLQDEQLALTELTALVVGVQLSTDRLGQSTLYNTVSVSSSASNTISARNVGSPKPGTYTFTPIKLAQSQQLTSSLFASSDHLVGEGEITIHTGGFLDQQIDLDQLNGGAGVNRGKIRITDRSGNSEVIDLRFAKTANDVIDAINAQDGLKVVASLDGDAFRLQDVSGSSTTELQVDEVGGGTTAAGLGLAGISVSADTATGISVRTISRSTSLSQLRDGRGIELPTSGSALSIKTQDGTTTNIELDLDAQASSLGQLIDSINSQAVGKVEVRIAADGKSLEIEDLTTGSAALEVSSSNGDLASQLGFSNAATGNLISGDQLVAGLGDVLLASLNGGQGYGQLGTISITDRSGAAANVDLSGAHTLRDVIDAINDSGIGVRAQLNRTQTGIEVLDTTGSTSTNLLIADADASSSATKLQLASSVATTSIDTGSLNRQFVSRNTLLSTWKTGQGLTLGSIRFTDTAGNSSAINLSQKKAETIGDVLDAINGLSIGVEARLNDAGDGIVVVDTAGGSGTFSVQDVGSGTSASKLGIAGEGTGLIVNGNAAIGIDGSQTLHIQTTDETTVADLAEAFNDLSGPINANVLSLGSNGVRLLLNGVQQGQLGRVTIGSTSSISFSETTAAQDALVAFGASESGGGVLVGATSNKIVNVVEDLEFTISSTSETPVTITVAENTDSVNKQIQSMVDQFNKMRDKLDTLTAFDATNLSVGILFGTNEALRIDMAFGRLFSTESRNGSSIRSLTQLGVRLNDSGKLEFDKDKFQAAIEADPEAVKTFFTDENNGFSAQAKKVTETLAGVDSGVLLNRNATLQTKLEQNNQRIESLNVRLDRQRERLLKQFYDMETAIASLQQNLTALNQLQIIPPLGSTSA